MPGGSRETLDYQVAQTYRRVNGMMKMLEEMADLAVGFAGSDGTKTYSPRATVFQ